MIKSRVYHKEDYQRVIDFLSQSYRLNQNHHSWLPASWEYAVYLVNTTQKRVLALEACFAQAKEDGVTILEIGDEDLNTIRQMGLASRSKARVHCWSQE